MQGNKTFKQKGKGERLPEFAKLKYLDHQLIKMPKKNKLLKSMKRIVDIRKFNIDENIRKQLPKTLSSLHENSLQA